MKKNKTVQLIVPDLYIRSLNKQIRTQGIISLEDLIKLVKYLPQMSLYEYELNEYSIFSDYTVVLAILIWGAQTNLCTSLIIENKSNNSREKAFQQTDTHNRVAKLLSSSPSSTRLMTLMATQKAINKNLFGINDEERQSDSSIIEAITETIEELTTTKGPGTTKLSVRDKESRIKWLRANISSIRSKWISSITYSPNKLITAGNSLRNYNLESFWKYIENLQKTLIEEKILTTPLDLNLIKSYMKTIITTLGLENKVDDTPYGKASQIYFDEAFSVDRSIEEVKPLTTPLPNIMENLKSK